MDAPRLDEEEEDASLRIELGPARLFEPAAGETPARRNGHVCLSVGRRYRGQPRVFVSLSAWQAAGDHVAGDASQELGGLLWGLPGRDGREEFLEVVEARPATAAQGGLGHLTFGQEAWQEVLREQVEGHRVVGWYHSHPGFGIFLSEQDSFIQRNFFGQPWQVALVLDPVRGEWGLYGWQKGEVIGWRGFELFAPVEQREALAAQVAQARRAKA